MDFNTSEIISTDNVSLFPTNKKRIILAHTSAKLPDHFAKLHTRLNGKYDRSPAFTISKTGVIYQHFDSSFYTSFMVDKSLHEDSIIVCLENMGPLFKNDIDGSYVDWKGNRFRGRVFEKSWRERKYWDKYTQKQIHALIQLVDYLCIEHNIEKKFIDSNIIKTDAKDFNGITCRSNFESKRFDLNPSMDFNKLNEKLSKYG